MHDELRFEPSNYPSTKHHVSDPLVNPTKQSDYPMIDLSCVQID